MIPLALIGQAASFLLPKIFDVVSGNKSVLTSAKEVANEVLDDRVKPFSTSEELKKEILKASPGAQVKFIERMMKKDAQIHKECTSWLDNVMDAREMYEKTNHDTADKLADRVMKWNLPVILALVLINIASVIYLKENGTVIAIISNFIGMAMGQLFTERQSVVNFFFGSSKGSKEKQDKINFLKKG